MIMIKFCPMCGTKVRPNDKLCTKCGLNFFAYQKKLDRLASEIFDIDVSSTFDLKSYISSLNEKYGHMSHVYFNVDDGKNQLKINSALNSYAQSAKNENVIFVFDDTLFGGAEDGFLVTDKSIYAHNLNQKAFSTSHLEVREFSLKLIRFGSDQILINGEKNFAIEISGCDEFHLKNLIQLLNEIHLNFTKATPCRGAVSTPPQTSKYCRIDDYRRRVEDIAEEFPLRCIYFYTIDCDRKTTDKINSAVNSYVKKLHRREFPLVVFDSTALGSADCGCLFTNLGIYIHNDNEDTVFINYKNIDENTVTERGIFIMDVYVGEQKIETSVCGYDRDERATFAVILLLMKKYFWGVS